MSILVAGGSGRLGTLLVERLAARGLEVRVLTRDPARADHLAGPTTEIVQGDVRDPASVTAAMAGVDMVVSAVHGFAGPGRVSPASVDREGNANLVDAAAAVAADVVLMSVVGASPTHPMELFRAKFAAEQYLRSRDLSWTIVRATAFVQLWAEIMAKPIVLGRGENPINFVSAHDVAGALERAVIDGGLRDTVLEVGGPQNLTFNQLAELLQQAREQRATVRHIPRWLLHTMTPFARQARAAIAMDTIDMTFDAAPHRLAFADVPLTSVETALARS